MFKPAMELYKVCTDYHRIMLEQRKQDMDILVAKIVSQFSNELPEILDVRARNGHKLHKTTADISILVREDQHWDFRELKEIYCRAFKEIANQLESLGYSVAIFDTHPEVVLSISWDLNIIHGGNREDSPQLDLA